MIKSAVRSLCRPPASQSLLSPRQFPQSIHDTVATCVYDGRLIWTVALPRIGWFATLGFELRLHPARALPPSVSARPRSTIPSTRSRSWRSCRKLVDRWPPTLHGHICNRSAKARGFDTQRCLASWADSQGSLLGRATDRVQDFVYCEIWNRPTLLG